MGRIAVALTLVSMLFASTSHTAEEEPLAADVVLEVGATRTFKLPDSVTNDAGDEKVVKVRGPVVEGVASGKKTITFRDTGTPPKPLLIATVTVTEINPVIKLKRNQEITTITDAASAVTVFTGDEYQLTVQGHNSDGTLRPIEPKAVESSLKTVVQPDPNLQEIKIALPPNDSRIDPPPAEAAITIELPDGKSHIIRFRVVEQPASVRVELPPTVRERTDTTIPVTVTGTAGGVYHSLSAQFGTVYRYSCNYTPTANAKANDFVAVGVPDGMKLRASRINTEEAREKGFDPLPNPNGLVKCTAFPLGRDNGVNGEAKIAIVPSGGSIRLSPPTLTLFGGQQGTVEAKAFDRSNKAIPDAHVSWELMGGGDAAVLTPQSDTMLMLTVSSDPSKIPPTGILTIVASTPAPDGSVINTQMAVKVVGATGFTRVRGSLEMLDYRTAKDLYGSQTAEDFFVAKITLLNDLGADLAGSSILVFSSSLEVGVNMQKAECAGAKPPRHKCKKDGKEVKWEPVRYRDLRRLGLPVDYPLNPDALPRRFAPGAPRSEFDESIVYTCDDIWYEEQRVQLTAEEEKNEQVRLAKQRDHDDRVAASRLRQLHYRPYPYDMVVKSFDPRDQRTTRSLTFRALTFAGSVASFVTGVPNFGASKQFIAVNEKFANVLVPALAAAWPSMRETQRQNLVSDTMHPIEEIPYASSLTKMIFLPKYPFQGFAADTWFRISEICPFDFKVQVALSSKRSSQKVQVDTAPAIVP